MFPDPARENRCTGITSVGQCSRDAQPGNVYCQRHGSHRDLAEEQDKHLYHLLKAKDRERLIAAGEHENVKTLRDEIHLTRMLIEDFHNTYQTDTERLAQSGKINALLLTVDKLVNSCNTLEQKLGSLLAKPALIAMATELINIITDELKGIVGYEDIVDRISDRMLRAILNAGNPQQS